MTTTEFVAAEFQVAPPPTEPAVNRRFPRDEFQVVRNGRVIYAATRPLYAWLKGGKWASTRVHLIGAHGRSSCGHVDLKTETKLKRYRVSRHVPSFLFCRHCNWYGTLAPYA
jgi:hypothetical protein